MVPSGDTSAIFFNGGLGASEGPLEFAVKGARVGGGGLWGFVDADVDVVAAWGGEDEGGGGFGGVAGDLLRCELWCDCG